MHILFLQLPVPTLVPHKNTGNHLLASSSLFIHLKRIGVAEKHHISTLPQEICSRGGDSHIVNCIEMIAPDIVACTCTVWNIERTLYLTEIIKSTLPNVKIWLGGPEVASDSYFINQQDWHFDCAVEGEGEEVFRLLVEGNDPAIIDRVYTPASIKKDIQIFPSNLENLRSIHEPFINGFAEMEQDRVILSELYRGCSYGCLFCRYHSGETKKNFALRPYEQVQSLFEWARTNNTNEIFLLDPSFEQRPDCNAFLDFLSTINKDPVIPIFAELRAEAVNAEFADKLYNAGIFHVETGLQTVTRKALQNSCRSFDKDAFVSGIRNLQKKNIKIRPDIMIGLPGDTPDGLRETAKFVMDLDLAPFAQVFKTQVLPGTGLRKHASKFGIEFEQRPPYQVIATPQWSKTDMNSSLFEAEELLGIQCTPEECPVIVCKSKIEVPFSISKFNETDIVYAYYFDCTNERGRDLFSKETFLNAAFTVSLTCAFDNYDHTSLIRNCLTTFYRTNPFSSSVVALQIPHAFPLDIFDLVNEIKSQYSMSNYLQSLYPTTYSATPHRRTLACIDLSFQQAYSQSWLDSLRDVAELVWVVKDTSDIIKRLETFPFLENVDYISIDSKLVLQDIFDTLAYSPFAGQFIFSDLYTQWEFLEFTVSS